MKMANIDSLMTQLNGLKVNNMKKISILMIGNSFAVDVAAYAHQISLCTDVELDIGVLYIGGCSLETHCNHIGTGVAEYEWYFNGESTQRWITLEDGLKDRKWDYITLQQVSGLGGVKESYYPYINQLIDYVRKFQPEAEFVMHETWPYPSYSDHNEFVRYNNNREIMFECLHKTYFEVAKELGINIIIQSGDIVENAILKYGEHFHRDGFHMNNEGRYLIGLGFVKKFSSSFNDKKIFIPNDEKLNYDICCEYSEFVSQIIK